MCQPVSGSTTVYNWNRQDWKMMLVYTIHTAIQTCIIACSENLLCINFAVLLEFLFLVTFMSPLDVNGRCDAICINSQRICTEP